MNFTLLQIEQRKWIRFSKLTVCAGSAGSFQNNNHNHQEIKD